MDFFAILGREFKKFSCRSRADHLCQDKDAYKYKFGSAKAYLKEENTHFRLTYVAQKGDVRMRARKEKTEQLFFFAARGFTGYARGAWLHVFFPSPFVLLTCFHPFGTCYTLCHVSSLPLTAALLGNLFLTHATPCRWEITLALHRLA